MSETDKLWRTNPAQYRAEKLARELRAGETVICETASSAYATIKSLRKVLTPEEQARVVINTAVGTVHRTIRLDERNTTQLQARILRNKS